MTTYSSGSTTCSRATSPPRSITPGKGASLSDVVEAPSPASQGPRLLRDRSGAQRVTNIELFFDLVYVFAVTQLSHHLLGEPTIGGAFQTAILLGLVWLAWAYTTWVTNWLDPERLQVRLLLVALMLVSLAMSAALPH